jgi:hypothetical protein
VAPNAGELIQPWALAMSSKLKIKAMIDMVAAYPTLTEVSKRAATSYYAESAVEAVDQEGYRGSEAVRLNTVRRSFRPTSQIWIQHA